MVRGLYQKIFAAGAVRVGAPRARVKAAGEIYENLVSHVQGRIYYNLSSWYAMFGQVPGAGKFVAVWEEMLGITPSDSRGAHVRDQVRQALGLLKTFARLAWNGLTVNSEIKKARTRFAGIHEGFLTQDLRGLSPRELLALHLALQDDILDGWDVTLLNDGYAFIHAALARTCLARLGLAEPASLLNDLLADADTDMESAQAVESTKALVKRLKDDPALRGALATHGMKALDDMRHGAFRNAFFSHLARFGDRVTGKLKLETVPFRQRPQDVVDLLVHASSAQSWEMDGGSGTQRAHAARDTFGKAASRNLVWGRLARLCVAQARACMVNRENSRLDRARAYGVARAIFTAMGEALVGKGRLAGRMSCFIDPLNSEPDTAFFGHFDCVASPAAAFALFSAGRAWAKRHGKARLAGPMDFTIWRNYRFLSQGQGLPPFLGEPRTPRYFNDLIEACGFKSRAVWRTYDFPVQVFEGMLEACESACTGHARDLARYVMRPFALDSLAGELALLHGVFMDTFSGNYGFSPLPPDEFAALFAPLGRVLNTRCSRLVLDPDGAPVGFSLVFANPLAPGSAILHSFGLHPEHRKGGLAHKLIAEALVALREEGCGLIHVALVKEGKNFFQKWGPAARVYQVYESPV